MKPLRWRFALISILTILSAYAAAPTVIYFLQPLEIRNDPEAFQKILPSWLPKEHVKLGLDLQGGVQLVMGVNTEGAIENKLSHVAVDVTRWAGDNSIGVETAYVPKGKKFLTVVLKADQDFDKFNELFFKEFSLLSKIKREGNSVNYGYKDAEMERIKKSALEQAEHVIRSRIDRWGVSEAMINRRADGSVLVQLPGFKDPQKAKELLGKTAQLKFKIVDDAFTGLNDLKDKAPKGITATTNGGQTAFAGENRDEILAFIKDKIPEDREILFAREQLADGTGGKGSKYRWTTYVVHAATELTGDDVLDASIAQGGGLDRKPVVALRFTGQGGRRFAEVTGANVHKRMAIILDEVVESAPNIQQKISGGNATITLGGGRSYNEIVEEGTQLALVLKSGAIPAAISVLEERQVGASLGPELANQGIKGSLVGLSLVFLFMMLYYRRPGMIACAALALNALYMLAIMAGFGFALSLPGIAAFILTLGIAVDANVLINERIRQELREGKHPKKAVDAGFKKVIWTIIDGHVTTLLASFVLLETNGSGPIRGFAISIIIGLIVSLFTSLNCTEFFFDICLMRKSDKQMKAFLGGDKVHKTRTMNFDFLKYGALATAIASLIGIAAIGTAFTRGLNFGVDFAGGTEAMIAFEKDIEAEQIRVVAEKSHLEGFSIQALGGGKKQYLIRYDEKIAEAATSEEHKVDNHLNASVSEVFHGFKNHLLSDLGDYKPEVQQVDFVGPQVGKELRNQGILSVFYAILAVLLYIALRFDMRFAPGAVVKMFLDIFCLLTVYAFFWVSFDLVAVAAFLTVVGYAVNDTIVIYDRIRENLVEHPRRTLRETVNISLNETLSRSLNTSLVTFLSLTGILAFGTGQIWNFALTMGLGIIAATLSSIFIATFFVIWFENWRNARQEKAALAQKV